MRRLISLLVFLVVAIILVGNLIAWITGELGASTGKVGIIHLYGEITTADGGGSLFGDGWSSADNVCRLVRDAEDDEDIAGVVLRVNSPGGTIAGSQEIYDAVKELAAEKPVVVSMGDVGASGAYYIAAAAHEIVANPGTTTGSIGVIAFFMNAKGLFQKIGLDYTTVKSGKFKDIGNIARSVTEDERALIKSIVMDDYEQFIEAVIEGRKAAVKSILAERVQKSRKTAAAGDNGNEAVVEVPAGATTETADTAQIADSFAEEWIRSYADGRIFNGRQGLAYGFVDHLGNFHDAVKLCGRKAGLPGEPDVVSLRTKPNLLDVLFEMSSRSMPVKVRVPTSLHLKFILP